jgi:hypothetical protein
MEIRKLHQILGYAVAQLVEALNYNPEGRDFDSREGIWGFFLPTHPLTEISTRVISLGGKFGRCVGLTNFAPL